MAIKKYGHGSEIEVGSYDVAVGAQRAKDKFPTTKNSQRKGDFKSRKSRALQSIMPKGSEEPETGGTLHNRLSGPNIYGPYKKNYVRKQQVPLSSYVEVLAQGRRTFLSSTYSGIYGPFFPSSDQSRPWTNTINVQIIDRLPRACKAYKFPHNAFPSSNVINLTTLYAEAQITPFRPHPTWTPEEAQMRDCRLAAKSRKKSWIRPAEREDDLRFQAVMRCLLSKKNHGGGLYKKVVRKYEIERLIWEIVGNAKSDVKEKCEGRGEAHLEVPDRKQKVAGKKKERAKEANRASQLGGWGWKPS